MRTAVCGLGLLALGGCWAGARTPLPDGPIEWEPIAGSPDGAWVVVELQTQLACPDGDAARLWLARPAEPQGAMPIAVIFHGGAFDYRQPGDTDGVGDSWRQPTRLDRDWADRRAFAALGMWASGDEAVAHTGALPLALAERDHAILSVANCWGDYGFNQGDNNTNLDGFERHGGSMTRLAWQLASVEGFAAAQGLDMGLTPDTSSPVAVGLGHGGRSVGVIAKTGALPAPAAVVLDSVDDDLRVYFDEPGIFSEQVTGLERIWPGGRSAALQSRLGNATLPAATHLVVSAADPRLPSGIIDELATRVTAAGGTVTDTGATRHIQLAGDLELARTVVASILGDSPVDDTDTDT